MLANLQQWLTDWGPLLLIALIAIVLSALLTLVGPRGLYRRARRSPGIVTAGIFVLVAGFACLLAIGVQLRWQWAVDLYYRLVIAWPLVLLFGLLCAYAIVAVLRGNVTEKLRVWLPYMPPMLLLAGGCSMAYNNAWWLLSDLVFMTFFGSLLIVTFVLSAAWGKTESDGGASDAVYTPPTRYESPPPTIPPASAPRAISDPESDDGGE